MSFYRKYNLLFQDIILVGCGGTGSRVISPLIQVIKQSTMQINPCLYLVDGDIFEDKNLARQNCILRDMGRNKAVVMAERYGAAHDFPIVAYTEFVTSQNNLYNCLSNAASEQGQRRLVNTRKLIIMCVDSVNARLAILDQCNPGDVIIDAGNEDSYGNCSIFDKVSMPHVIGVNDTPFNIKPFSGDCEIPFIPAPINMYLEAMVNPSESTGSCALLDQSLAINNLMAASIINKVQNLAYNNPFYSRTDYFDLHRGNTSERMTNVWFNQVFNETTEYSNDSIREYSNDYICNYTNGYKVDTLPIPGIRGLLFHKLMEHINSNVTYVDPALLAALGK